MKSLILILACLFLFPAFVFAQDDDSNYWSKYSIYRNTVMQPKQPQQNTADQPSQKTIVNDELYQKVYENYGCIYSPGYLNRENIDTGETNNGFTGR